MMQVLAEGVAAERQHHSSCLAPDFPSSSPHHFFASVMSFCVATGAIITSRRMYAW
jgi:hypothetical protein